MDFSGIFQSVEGWVIASVGGVSLAGIISFIIWAVLKSAFNKVIIKANLKATQEESAKLASQQAVAQIKELSFKQSIQPVVERELKKIVEQAQELVAKELDGVNNRYDKLVNVLEALASYFDNSIGVSDEAKQNLKDALAEAKEIKIEPEIEQNIKVEEVVKEDVKVENTADKSQNSAKVER